MFDEEAMNMLYQALKNYDPFNETEHDAAKTIDRVGKQAEAYCIQQGWSDLADDFKLQRLDALSMCNEQREHKWEIGRPQWSSSLGHYFYRATCIHCCKTISCEDIPYWQHPEREEVQS